MFSLIQRRLVSSLGLRQSVLNVPFQRSMAVMRIVTADDYQTEKEYQQDDEDCLPQKDIEAEWRHTLENMGCDPGYGMRKEALKRKYWLMMKKQDQKFRRSRLKMKQLLDLAKYEKAMQ